MYELLPAGYSRFYCVNKCIGFLSCVSNGSTRLYNKHVRYWLSAIAMQFVAAANGLNMVAAVQLQTCEQPPHPIVQGQRVPVLSHQ